MELQIVLEVSIAGGTIIQATDTKNKFNSAFMPTLASEGNATEFGD